MDLGQQGAARDRDDDVIGQAPAELFGGLEPERLRALRVVRPHVHVHERPGERLRDLGAEPIDVVVVALHGDDLGAVGLGREDLRALEVVGHEHVARHPGVGGVRGSRVREVAGGSAGQRLEAERARHRGGDRDDAVLERIRRVDRVVLDPEIAEAEHGGEPVRAAERREAGAEVDPVEAGPAGQERLVAPQRGGPGLDLLAEIRPVDRVQLVGGLERAEAFLADRERLDVVALAADPALQRRRAS